MSSNHLRNTARSFWLRILVLAILCTLVAVAGLVAGFAAAGAGRQGLAVEQLDRCVSGAGDLRADRRVLIGCAVAPARIPGTGCELSSITAQADEGAAGGNSPPIQDRMWFRTTRPLPDAPPKPGPTPTPPVAP